MQWEYSYMIICVFGVETESTLTVDCRFLEGDFIQYHTCIKGPRNIPEVTCVIQDISQHPLKLGVDILNLSFIVWIDVLRHTICNNTS